LLQGLVQVFEEQLPGVEHRFCLRHLYANFKKKFGGGTLLRDLMMGAAKSTYFEAWEEKMLKIKDVKEEAYNWLNVIPPKKWCKHAFPFYSRCDVLMNNLSESFNATILLQRDKPIITMFEWIRTYLMVRFATLREKVNEYGGVIMPKPLRRLDREIEKSASWAAIYSGGMSFQVTTNLMTESFIVNLDKKTCSCNFWELVGIPCRHAVAAITKAVEDPVNYVHSYYNKQTYMRCYDHGISPINGKNMWPKTNDPDILPPQYKRGPGRPKKLRRREPDDGNGPRWRRSYTTHRCNKCFAYGHNSRTCKLPKPKECATTTTVDVVPTQASQTIAPKKRVCLKLVLYLILVFLLLYFYCVCFSLWIWLLVCDSIVMLC